MKSEFYMIGLGELAYFLGIEFVQTGRGIILHQKRYIHEVFKRFNKVDYNIALTPLDANIKLVKDEAKKLVDNTLFKQLIGSFRYVCNNKPDISYGVGLVSRFMKDTKQSHLVIAKRFLRYLKGTSYFGVLFPKKENQCRIEMYGYSNSNWCGDKVNRNSTMGYCSDFVVHQFHGVQRSKM